jgi:hypothetical protein
MRLEIKKKKKKITVPRDAVYSQSKRLEPVVYFRQKRQARLLESRLSLGQSEM